MSNESLQAIINHAEIVNAAIPDDMPGSGPIRLHLTEIIAEAGAMVELRKALNNDGTIMTAPDTDHAPKRFKELAAEGAVKAIQRTCDDLEQYYGDGTAFHAKRAIMEQTGLLVRHLEEARAELATERARGKRYRAALEAEFAYNMLAIVSEHADPRRTTEAAQVALETWQELKRHDDPVGHWPGYQPGDLPEDGEGEVTT